MVAMIQSLVLGLSALTVAVQGYSVPAPDYSHYEPVEACPVGHVPYTVNVIPHLVYYPIYVHTYVPSNTIIIINGGVEINVTNAPTSISTVVTATTTSFVTETVTDTSGTIPTVTDATGPTATGIACVFDADCAPGTCINEVCSL